MLSRVALILAALALAAVAFAAGPDEHRPSWHREPILWKQSRSLGKPWAGRLVNGVQLPSEGAQYFTWDPILKTTPNRPWRRWGSDRLVRILLHVLDGYFDAHPEAPRVAVGDLSRPQGGTFDERFGGIGHASHQNGLDIDVYYPRIDGQERAPERASEVDRALAQDLVTRFVRAGATNIFVGPRLGLRGPHRVVEPLRHHDNHLHVRIRRDPGRRLILGRSTRGRPIEAVRVGDPTGRPRILVIGCVHGNECAGVAATRQLERARPQADLWVVHHLNPDGYALGRRQNARGVDLNRNFDSEWEPMGRRWSPEYSGPRPFSERESRIARRLILGLRPDVTIWFHQPQAVVRAWGPSIPEARTYARLAGVKFKPIRWPAGTAPNWQNHRLPGKPAFVVELPPGPLSPRDAERHVRTILGLTQ
ncbi:MAG: penicillin-insensitive murein endopeptidase [Actinobacteria bacterium]|nr:penicillin-insensitive murein endopeptidase [Actinomycetota bacterium]